MSNADWLVVTVTNAATRQAQVVRILNERPQGTHVPGLRNALTITWKYSSTSLFPAGDDKDAMLEFERAMDPLSSENGSSELVQVSTGGGLKEWLYYVSEPHAFVDALNKHLDGLPRYPLDIKWYDDPDWKIWNEARANIKSRAENL